MFFKRIVLISFLLLLRLFLKGRYGGWNVRFKLMIKWNFLNLNFRIDNMRGGNLYYYSMIYIDIKKYFYILDKLRIILFYYFFVLENNLYLFIYVGILSFKLVFKDIRWFIDIG